jgi:hypothetical protein
MHPLIREEWAGMVAGKSLLLGRGFLCHIYQGDDEALKGEELFCPLGMLCKLGVEWKAIDEPITVTYYEDALVYKMYDNETGILPSNIVRWAGLSSRTPGVSPTPKQRRMWGLPRATKSSPTIPLHTLSDTLVVPGVISRQELANLIRKL